MPDRFEVRVDGVRELVRAIGKVDIGYRKEIGQANKAIGQRIIDQSFPKPESVGAGTGAIPRASANTTSLRIMAGRTNRKHHAQQWGARFQRRVQKRPYIRKAAEQNVSHVEREWMGALLTVARKAGFKTKG